MSTPVHNPVDRFDQLWARGETVNVFGFATQVDNEDLQRIVLLDQFHRWQNGCPLGIEEYLREFETLASNHEWVAELCVEEFGYRQQNGRNPDVADFLHSLPIRDSGCLQQIRNELAFEQTRPSATLPHDQASPSSIGRFSVVRELGRGAFGCVFLARDPQLDRLVAIKIFSVAANQRFAGDDAALIEARTVAAIDHPAIVPVYEFGEDEKLGWYIVSKYLPGGTLSERMQDETPLVTRLQWIARIAEGLEVAHAQGIFHRDIKPANVLMDETGAPCLADFGLAWSNGSNGTKSGLVGTPAWMSPEQARDEGHLVDARSDVFSLGVILYELLSGRRPFVADNVPQLLNQIATASAVPPRHWNDRIPLGAERICTRALARRQSERYQTAREFAADLRRLLAESSPQEVGLETEVIPTGLRSFDTQHSHFFLTLLPGPHTLDGIPESIAFWKSRCEATDDTAFRVGLFYGPSGCGKTSFVRAGLLPRLADHVSTIAIEAAAFKTIDRIRSAITSTCELDVNLSLPEMLRELRQSNTSTKTLLIIDQLEQCLGGFEIEELTASLRQCDGIRVQCLLLVRDDFWMATTDLFRNLDVRLSDQTNSRGLELFGHQHAKRVLRFLGRAYGRLPTGEPTDEQRQFMQQAVDDIADSNRVSPVKVSLLAEMLKDQPWTPATLDKIGGASALGYRYLENSFGETAPPAQRAIAESARAVLRELMPSIQSEIKAAPVSESQLRVAVGAVPENDFDELLQTLDRDLQFISRVESSESGEEPRYQLTHDFLVSPIRKWIRRHEQTSWRGWMMLRLTDRDQAWQRAPSARTLPSLWETAAIHAFTRRSDWSETQRSVMGKATWFHTVVVTAMMCLFLGVFWIAQRYTSSMQSQAMVDRLLSARTIEVPSIIHGAYEEQAAFIYLLQQADPAKGDVDADEIRRRQLRIDLALLDAEPKRAEAVVDRLLDGSEEQYVVVHSFLADHSDRVSSKLWRVASDDSLSQSSRLRALASLAQYEPSHENWNSQSALIAELLTTVPPAQLRGRLGALNGVAKPLIGVLETHLNDDRRGESAALALATFLRDNPQTIIGLLQRATAKELGHFIDALQHDQSTTGLLEKAWQQQTGSSVQEIRGRANLAVALLRVLANENDRSQDALALKIANECLLAKKDNTLRSNVVHRFGPSGGRAETLWPIIQFSTENTVRSGAILALGRCAPSSIGSVMIDRLVDLFDADPNPSVHSAVEWLLNRIGQGSRLQEIQTRLATGDFVGNRDWYISKEGHTMIRLPGVAKIMVGADAKDPERLPNDISPVSRTIPGPFVISAKEVSVAQYEEFDDSPRGPGKQNAGLATERPHGPILQVTWFNAAAYCDWMDGQDGVKIEQRCYEPNPRGEFYLGANMMPNRLQRTGYQLPSVMHWFYASAAGTKTPRFFGRDTDLLRHYCWTAETSRGIAKPVGTTMPNAWGIFDSLGNAAEWTGSTRFQEETDDGFVPYAQSVGRTTAMRMVGGSFNFGAKLSRVGALQNAQIPTQIRLATGIRLMRILDEKAAK